MLLVVLELEVSDVSAFHWAGQSSLSRRSPYEHSSDLVSVVRLHCTADSHGSRAQDSGRYMEEEG